MKIEVRNESNQPIYVSLCETKAGGNFYLHVSLERTKHEPFKVEPNYYLQVESEKVEL
jgi:hypothetical protein